MSDEENDEPQPPAIEQPPDLTDEDEGALDRAWESVTDEDIEASIRWLNETEQDEQEAEHTRDTSEP